MNYIKSKQTGILSTSDLKGKRGQIIYWCFFIILAVTAFLSLFPVLWAIMTSLKETQEIYTSTKFLPQNFTLENTISRVRETWKYLRLTDTFLNTIAVSIGQILVNIICCGLGGYVLSKIKPAGYKIVFTLVVWTMMMPTQVTLVPTYISYLHFPFGADIGLGVNVLDTYIPLWLLPGANCFAVLLFKNAFDGLSDSYVDAARIDGCSNLGVFLKIMLPLAKPVVLYQVIRVMNVAWSDFFNPLLILDEKATLPLVIYRLQFDQSIQWNTYYMALVLACIPPFIIFVFCQKQIIGGVNIGGVKG